MANVLSDTKRQQVLALGRLGWPLRRIEDATGVRRETASAYLRAAGIAIRAPGGWGRRLPKPAKEPSTDSPAAPPAKPANAVSTDSGPPAWPPRPGRSPQASACEPHREVIGAAVQRGRNAMAIWQDLVDQHGFRAGYASVQRFVKTLRGAAVPEAHPVIVTAPGEDYGKSRVMLHATSRRRSAMTWRRSPGVDVRIIPYSASSQAKRSFGSRPRLGIARVGVPAWVSASRFMSRSIWM